MARSTAAGYESAWPTAKIAVPTRSPVSVCQAPIVASPIGEVDEAKHECPPRRQPVGKLPAEGADEDDDRAEEREDEAGPVDAELPRVERREGDEAAEAEQGEHDEQAGEEGRARRQPATGRLMRGGRPGFAERDHGSAGENHEQGRDKPGGREATVAEDEVGGDRADRQPEVGSRRDQAHRLATPVRRREVCCNREHGDRERSLARTRE